jgi:Rap1a immunity proteins
MFWCGDAPTHALQRVLRQGFSAHPCSDGWAEPKGHVRRFGWPTRLGARQVGAKRPDPPSCIRRAGTCQARRTGIGSAAGRHVYIPSTREALTCWGYMQAMQDLSVLADENGHRIMEACPPEETTTLQLVRSFVRYARAHRRELPGNAVVAVFRALREDYPCRPDHED